MKTDFRKGNTDKKSVIFLFIMSVATGILSAFVGHVIAAVCAGFIASVWYFESEDKRVFSYISSAVVILADFLINGIYSTTGVFAVALGLMIFFVYRLRVSKCDAVFGMTIAASVLIVIAYVLLAMGNKGGLSVKEFYTAVYEEYKAYFIESFNEMYELMPALKENVVITDEDIVSVLDSMVAMLVSFVIIYGFALVGIGCKIFKILVTRYSKDKAEMSGWRFITPSIYAYFYIALTLAGLFAGTELNTFALVVMNLSNVFMVVYAYIGWSFLSRILASRKSPVLVNVILFLVIISFANLALNLLSFVGMFHTITYNKFYDENSHHSSEQ